jgi:hypothetical protein
MKSSFLLFSFDDGEPRGGFALLNSSINGREGRRNDTRSVLLYSFAAR